jgi:hypothetical protein
VRSLRERVAEGLPITAADAGRLDQYLCASEARISAGSSLRLEVLGLTLRPEFAFTLKHPTLDPITDEYLKTWRTGLDRFLARAPARSDLAVPYLLWRLEQGRDEEVLALSGRLLRNNPSDAVGLWFSGIVLLGDEDTVPMGIVRLKRSLRVGIERFIPIDESLRQQIED